MSRARARARAYVRLVTCNVLTCRRAYVQRVTCDVLTCDVSSVHETEIPRLRRLAAAGTSTRPSTTGRMRGPLRAVTSRSGSGSLPRRTGPVLELGCGTGRISIPVARACARSSASIVSRRCSLAPVASEARGPDGPHAARPRRHPLAAVPQPGRLSPRDGAVRNAAVAHARSGSHGDARVGAPRSEARGGMLGDGSRARPSALVRIPAPDEPARTAGPAHDLTLVESVRQDRAPPPHHLRSGVRDAGRGSTRACTSSR